MTPKLILTQPTAWLILMLSALAACSADYCGDLVWNEALNTCECPEGTEPDYEMDACVGGGMVIPWGVEPSMPQDAGADMMTDSTVARMDAGVDAGPDSEVDAGQDAGPPPADVLTRFPWNGFATGSLHAGDGEPLMNHPLRPKFMWESAAGADHYQIQLTRECRTPDFGDCPFVRTDLDDTTPGTTFRPSESLPAARTRPVGNRYFWRVRACSEHEVCSRWSAVRYLDVGRESHDLNGDGYADVVVGADTQMMQGAAYIYFGGAAGPNSEPDTILQNPSEQTGGQFGSAVAITGDMNGDGFYDLAVGAVGQSMGQTGEGVAYIYYGGPEGVSAVPSLAIDNPADQPSGRFGTVAAPGDLNGDGFADLVVGAGAQDSPELNEGVAYIFLGGSDGVSQAPAVMIDNPSDTAHKAFGTFIGAGADFDGDGFSDFVVGAQGEAYVFVGGREIASEPSVFIVGASNSAFSFRGLALPGDLDGDGFADLAVGAVTESFPELREGAVHLFLGGREGVRDVPDVSVDNPADQEEGAFGSSPAFGDFNGDGFDELVVGAPQQSAPETREGSAFVFTGVALGGGVPTRTLNNPQNDDFGGFGVTMAVSDYNGDGYIDVVVGAWTQSDFGSAFVYFGGPSALALTPGVSLHNPESSAGRFGASLQ